MMKTSLTISYDPFEYPYPGMDMDDMGQAAVEQRDPNHIADHDVIEHGRQAITFIPKPTEQNVLQRLNNTALTKAQIEKSFSAILFAAGPRFTHILGGTRSHQNH